MDKFDIDTKNLTTGERNFEFAAKSVFNLADDPFDLFKKWFEDAKAAEINDPNAMTLSTITKLDDGSFAPNSRIVLCKGFDNNGFVFYTHATSAKGKELAQNSNASLLFHWKSLGKQVRIMGKVSLVDDETADRYFHSRPRGSQIGAWASKQSQAMPDRSEFHERFKKYEEEFAATEVIPRPDTWCGYLLSPSKMEFWIGHNSRLHDRVQYQIKRNPFKYTAEILYP